MTKLTFASLLAVAASHGINLERNGSRRFTVNIGEDVHKADTLADAHGIIVAHTQKNAGFKFEHEKESNFIKVYHLGKFIGRAQKWAGHIVVQRPATRPEHFHGDNALNNAAKYLAGQKLASAA